MVILESFFVVYFSLIQRIHYSLSKQSINQFHCTMTGCPVTTPHLPSQGEQFIKKMEKCSPDQHLLKLVSQSNPFSSLPYIYTYWYVKLLSGIILYSSANFIFHDSLWQSSKRHDCQTRNSGVSHPHQKTLCIFISTKSPHSHFLPP